MLGIVQGRLSFSGKKLQCFPKKPLDEFKLASEIGYDFIEFFGERINHPNSWLVQEVRGKIKSKKNKFFTLKL